MTRCLAKEAVEVAEPEEAAELEVLQAAAERVLAVQEEAAELEVLRAAAERVLAVQEEAAELEVLRAAAERVLAVQRVRRAEPRVWVEPRLLRAV